MRNLMTAAFILTLAGPAAAQQQPVEMNPMPGGDMGAVHAQMMQGMGATPAAPAAETASAPVSEPGQGAFAAIGEIVAALEADPATDWSKVDIDALRAHLRDMNLVVLGARASGREIAGGMVFEVTGEGPVAGAIRRMVLAHAQVMQGVGGRRYTAEATATGATLRVKVAQTDMPRLRGLGFFGILTSGVHHQPHHWMIATGQAPHG